ncbi:MAG TPA: DUF547 domain-containing protein [Vicinamibacterales bacterium]
MTLRLLTCLLLTAAVSAAELRTGTGTGTGQLPPPPDVDPRHRAYDQLLDINVRDGLVYYNAVKASRGGLARYIASLDMPEAAFARLSRDEQLALLINAYNAIVLHSVAANYPIEARVKTFPAKSIRQIPGVYDRKHRIGGRSVSLDELERWMLDEYKDPRVIFALGRGALGSGRLRSEAYTASRLDEQLADAAREFVIRQGHFRIDEPTNTVVVTPLYSWREKDFVAGYADKADDEFDGRSPIERAILALTMDHLFQSEQAYLRQNRFKVEFGTFDWRLNDLTGGRID